MAGLCKQHFIKIAEIIKEDLVLKDKTEITQGHINIGFIQDLSNYFKTQNPTFEENRFKKACLK